MLFLHGMDVKEGRPKDLHTRRTSFSIFSSGNKGWKLPFYVTILLLSTSREFHAINFILLENTLL